ncbi:MAG: response regulator transcription factor [Aristaeellaceae bacterium]
MRLLLAEDEQELSRALVAVLEHHQYQVTAVYDGEAALDALCAEPFDAAILDIMMPRMSGIEALQAARREGCTTPVLLLTAKSTVDDRVEGLDSGADDYLTKPFAMKELLARIRALSRRSSAMTDNLLRFENLTLDRVTLRLQCGDRAERLPNKEYRMLEMLMLRPGIVISTEQFMDSVWGWNSEADINVVWVYISKLRKHLAQLGAHAQIATSRGLGYYLEALHD